MKQRIFKDLLNRYENGRASKAERFLVDRWYGSFQDSNSVIPGLENEQVTEETARRIFNKIKLQRITKPWYYHYSFQAAGCLALIFAASLFWYTYTKSTTAQHAIAYHTLKGQTKKILLSDSTSIWLNANSSLKVLPGYAKKVREINLVGEAYFEVKHDHAHPFIVTTQGVRTQVLGTSFNISAYPRLNKLAVTVRTGKVSVCNSQSLLATLTPGKSLHINGVTHTTVVTEENPESLIAWRDGRILVADASFNELAEIFSNTLNVQLVSRNKNIQNFEFRLSLDKKLSVEDNLKIITGIHQLKYRRIEKNVIELY